MDPDHKLPKPRATCRATWCVHYAAGQHQMHAWGGGWNGYVGHCTTHQVAAMTSRAWRIDLLDHGIIACTVGGQIRT